MLLSNPGFCSRFEALFWGQVQATPVLQQRPLQRPLAHSLAAAQTWPAPFWGWQVVALQ
jgi:hypothetical protein